MLFLAHDLSGDGSSESSRSQVETNRKGREGPCAPLTHPADVPDASGTIQFQMSLPCTTHTTPNRVDPSSEVRLVLGNGQEKPVFLLKA